MSNFEKYMTRALGVLALVALTLMVSALVYGMWKAMLET